MRTISLLLFFTLLIKFDLKIEIIIKKKKVLQILKYQKHINIYIYQIIIEVQMIILLALLKYLSIFK